MRELTDHKQNDANEQITIWAMGDPGHGGACHLYRVFLPTPASSDHPPNPLSLYFQDGSIKEAGVNGLTHEVLLAVLLDRMRGFQAGEYACRENGLALDALQQALHWLQQRTNARVAHGVEGTHEK